ncbi:MAG: TonB-dependent receptor [Steroidobacteraceae bacterium]
MDEIVVTGSHIRGASTSTQGITIDRAEIDRTGFSTVESLVESLPQNFADVSPAGRLSTGGATLSGINNDRASSVNLRGLGAQSTLTLLDGVRPAGSVGGRVFDVSAIPLSMIERVDIVTDGRSAIYGADAVAGVVNFVTRREYQGSQTQVSYGGAEEGGERLQIGQLTGMKFEKGGFAIGYEYSRDHEFDLADAGLLTKDTLENIGGLEVGLQTQAPTWRHSALASGHYGITEKIELFASALYTDKRIESEERQLRTGAPAESVFFMKQPSRFYALDAGAEVEISPTWGLRITAASSANDVKIDPNTNTTVLATSSRSSIILRHDKSTVSSLSAIADGVLFNAGDFAPRLAVGAETLDQEFKHTQSRNAVAEPVSKNDRTVNSMFAELLLPFIQQGTSPLMHTLEVSIAGRYDDYSDFGDTTNPQISAMWEPLEGVRLRVGYAEAFRAPALLELVPANSALLSIVNDPQADTGTRPLLILRGENSGLEPETAKTFNVGLELQPAFWRNSSIAMGYFSVDYSKRIEVPAVAFNDLFSALTNSDRFVQLIDRAPSSAAAQAIVTSVPTLLNLTTTSFNPQTQNILAVFPGLATFDNRNNNIAVERVDGLDLQLKSAIPTTAGEFTYGINATYTLRHDRSVTTTSPSFSLLNEVGKATDFRARASVGYDSGVYGVFAFVNYTDGYRNPYSIPVSTLSSWTTVDLTFRAELFPSLQGGALRNLVSTLAVENVLDRAPPRLPSGSGFGVLYDSNNADPFGRYISLRVVKNWGGS